MIGFREFPIIAALWSGVMGAANAAEPLDCAGSQMEMNRCAANTAAAEDAELNRRYQRVLKRSDELERQLLREAQRNWIGFRDSNCRWEADAARGGSMTPLIEWSCRARMTRERLIELGSTMEDSALGIWSGIALARLRELAPGLAQNGVYWLPEGVRSADFDRDSRYDLAGVAIDPPDASGNGGAAHLLILLAAMEKPLHAVIPIGENGLCAAPAEASIEYPENAAPLFVLYDGTCDPLRVGVNASPVEVMLHRN